MKTIKLGDKVKDKITGVEGIAVSNITYKNGCEQFGVQQKVNEDGSVPEVQQVDLPDLTNLEDESESLKDNVKEPLKTSTGGGFRNHPE